MRRGGEEEMRRGGEEEEDGTQRMYLSGPGASPRTTGHPWPFVTFISSYYALLVFACVHRGTGFIDIDVAGASGTPSWVGP
jgi:hypothetical protein